MECVLSKKLVRKEKFGNFVRNPGNENNTETGPYIWHLFKMIWGICKKIIKCTDPPLYSYYEVNKKSKVWKLLQKSRKNKNNTGTESCIWCLFEMFWGICKKSPNTRIRFCIVFCFLQLLSKFPNYSFLVSFLIRIHLLLFSY